MDDNKIINSIALHQMTIEEVKQIKKNINENIDDIVRFDIRTRLIFHQWEPYISRIKNKLDVSSRTMLLICDEVINKEKERIDKLIDMEIENRKSKE